MRIEYPFLLANYGPQVEFGRRQLRLFIGLDFQSKNSVVGNCSAEIFGELADLIFIGTFHKDLIVK